MTRIALLLALACADAEPIAPADPVAHVTPDPEPPEPPTPTLAAADLTVPTDAAAIAAKLVEAERNVRDPRWTDGAVLDTWGHLQQRLYRALAQDPALADATLAHVPDDLREIAQANTRATKLGIATIPKPRTELPTWTIAPAPPADQLLAWYREAEAEHGTPWTLLAAVHLIETRMGRLRGVSYAGARGPMQFMPETWARWGKGDIEDPRDAIFAAARYLDAMGAPENVDKALWHYNQSKAYVEAVRTWHEILSADPLAYRGYHGWQVYYLTVRGSLWLPEGYAATEKIPVATWCDEDPTRCP